MRDRLNRVRALIALGIILGALVPPALYWYNIGRVPTVTPAEARTLMASKTAPTRLIDVRTPEAFARDHVPGAENVPLKRIMLLKSSAESPESLRHPALLICDAGLLSATATRKLRELGLMAANVRGGMQAWVASSVRPCLFPLMTGAQSKSQTPPPYYRPTPPFEQWLAFISGFIIKFTYMLLSLILVYVLWQRTSPDLVALRWAFIFFYTGEAFCAGNYIFFGDDSFLFENLHSYGMVLAFAFGTFAIFEGLDLRLVRFSDPKARCAALELCGPCAKHKQVPCGLKRVFIWLIPMFIVLALIPLSAQPVAVAYNTKVLGSYYTYTHLVPHQLYEIRFLPIVAIAFYAAAFLILLLKNYNPVFPAKILFAAGTGALAFSLFRLILFAPFRERMPWFVIWEEWTELLFVLAVMFVLWIFRNALFPHKTLNLG